MVCKVFKLWNSLPQDAVDAKSSQEEHRQAHRREVPWGLLKYPETTSSSRSISTVNSWELKDHLVKVLYTLLLFLQSSLRITPSLIPEEDDCAWRTISLNWLWPFLFLCFVLINKHNNLCRLTCWKESSNKVCLDTLIFTWLGSALDCNQKAVTSKCSTYKCKFK